MLLGQSVFQSVLDRLGAEEDGAAAEPDPAGHRIRGLNAGFAAAAREGVSAPSARPGDAYFDHMDVDAIEVDAPSAAEPSPLEVEPELPAIPEHLTRTAEADVAAELAIFPNDTLQTLADKRRAFARANHPDSVAPPFRHQATARMKIANALIDEAARRAAIVAMLRR
jgi:hypothetical protein